MKQKVSTTFHDRRHIQTELFDDRNFWASCIAVNCAERNGKKPRVCFHLHFTMLRNAYRNPVGDLLVSM